MGDKFNLSGDFRGSIINIKSTLTNVQQSVGEMHTGDPDAREALQGLIKQLSSELEKTPPARQEEAEAVAATAKELVDQAKKEKPNHTILHITGEGLKQAAKNLADVAPAVLTLATQIVLAVTRLSPGL